MTPALHALDQAKAPLLSPSDAHTSLSRVNDPIELLAAARSAVAAQSKMPVRVEQEVSGVLHGRPSSRQRCWRLLGPPK